MHRPSTVIISGQEAFERVGRLLTSMIRCPESYAPVGVAIVDLMPKAYALDAEELAISLQPFLRQYVLEDNKDDPYFDQRIMIEAVSYGTKAYRIAWDHQVPEGLNCADYRFKSFLHGDLALTLR